MLIAAGFIRVRQLFSIHISLLVPPFATTTVASAVFHLSLVSHLNRLIYTLWIVGCATRIQFCFTTVNLIFPTWKFNLNELNAYGQSSRCWLLVLVHTHTYDATCDNVILKEKWEKKKKSSIYTRYTCKCTSMRRNDKIHFEILKQQWLNEHFIHFWYGFQIQFWSNYWTHFSSDFFLFLFSTYFRFRFFFSFCADETGSNLTQKKHQKKDERKFFALVKSLNKTLISCAKQFLTVPNCESVLFFFFLLLSFPFIFFFVADVVWMTWFLWPQKIFLATF